MFFLLGDLYQKLSQYSSIFLYGTGMYAMEIYPKLCVMGCKKKIKGFIISGEPKKDKIIGISVFSVDKSSAIIDADDVVLIAVSEIYQEEIIDNLQRLGIENRLCLSDYLRTGDDILTFYKNKTSMEYCNYIFDWYVYNYSNQMFSRDEIIEKLLVDRRLRKNSKQIVFIIGIEMGMPRTVKILGALKKCGYEVIVLCYVAADGTIVKKELDEYGITVYKCNYIEEMMYKMLNYNPLVYYIDPVWGDCTWADILIQQKEMFGKIVLTLYDVLNDGFASVSEKQKDLERYALENADGIVWRWFSKQRLEEKGMCFKGKSIQFLDYCSVGGEQTQVGGKEDNEEIKFCLVSGYADALFEQASDNSQGYNLEAKIRDVLPRLLKDSKCSFHMFIWELSESNRAECRRLEEEYDNFKVFWKCEHKEVLNMISEYDYGIQLCTGEGKDVPDDVSINGRHYGSAYKNAVSNRFFDYLDAGIPIVATQPRKLCDFLAEYNVVIKMDLSNLDVEYLRNNKFFYKENILKAREELEINHQIGRLINFFNEVNNEYT